MVAANPLRNGHYGDKSYCQPRCLQTFYASAVAEYLTDIQQSYREYFKTADKFPIVVVDTTKLDFVRNTADYNYLKDIVLGRSYPIGVTYL